MALRSEPTGLTVGTRRFVSGAVLVLVAWLAAAASWVHEERARLALRPAQDSQRIFAELEAGARAAHASPPGDASCAVLAAQRAAAELVDLRDEYRRVRRRETPPDLLELVRENLAGLKVDAAWTRMPGRAPDWAPQGGPVESPARAMEGPCIAQLVGGLPLLANCREELVDATASRTSFFAGVLVVPKPVPAHGAWALVLAPHPDRVMAASSTWPKEGLRTELVTGASETASQFFELSTPGRDWHVEARRVRGLPLVGLVAVEPAVRLEWAALLRGNAGPSTHAWRAWVALTGAIGSGLLAGVALSAALLGRAFAPLVRAAGSVGQGGVDVAGLVERGDEIGALARTLEDADRSLTLARRAFEREARVAAWRDVARGLAHEIRNPLLPIRGTVENLLRWRREEPARFDANVESRLATILAEVEHLARLAASFSEFANLPAPARESVVMTRLVREAASMQAGAVGARVQMEDRLGDELPALMADAGQIRQVFANILKNAREAAGERPLRVVLRQGLAQDGRSQWTSIEDDGPGVPPDLLPRLFAPDFSTKKAEGGSGLGLWISQRIVVEHGGTIEPSAAESGGLCVTITLPCEDQHAHRPARG